MPVLYILTVFSNQLLLSFLYITVRASCRLFYCFVQVIGEFHARVLKETLQNYMPWMGVGFDGGGEGLIWFLVKERSGEDLRKSCWSKERDALGRPAGSRARGTLHLEVVNLSPKLGMETALRNSTKKREVVCTSSPLLWEVVGHHYVSAWQGHSVTSRWQDPWWCDRTAAVARGQLLWVLSREVITGLYCLSHCSLGTLPYT